MLKYVQKQNNLSQAFLIKHYLRPFLNYFNQLQEYLFCLFAPLIGEVYDFVTTILRS